MNVRPMDMQVIIPRATEVGKSQQTLNQQAAFQQEFGAEKMQQSAALRRQSVEHLDKSEQKKVRREKNDQEKGGRQDAGDGGERHDGDRGETGPDEASRRLLAADRDRVRGVRIDIRT